MNHRIARISVIPSAVLCLALFAPALWNGLQWIGTTFPGFLILEHRVIASVALPDWLDPESLVGRRIVAVDGKPVATSREVYAYVRTQPPGTRLRYDVQDWRGGISTEVIEARSFTQTDFAFLLGGLLVNGLAFVAVALVVVWMRPRRAASYGLLAVSMVVGVFVITAIDVRGSHFLSRLHILAESAASGALLHCAATLFVDRIRRRRALALLAMYGPCLLLGVLQAHALDDPGWYGVTHRVAGAAIAMAAGAMLGVFVYDLFTTAEVLVRRRVGLVLTTVLAIFFLPPAAAIAAQLVGGRLPATIASLTVFLLPLSVGFAVVKEDPLELDAVFQRVLTYTLALGVVALSYRAIALGTEAVSDEWIRRSPEIVALLHLTLLFSILPIRDVIEWLIDRLLTGERYDAEGQLSRLARDLASAQGIEPVIARFRAVLAETIRPLPWALYEHAGNGRFRMIGGARVRSSVLDVGPPVGARLARGEVVLAGTQEPDSSGKLPEARQQGFDLLVPISIDGTSVGLIGLGPKSSGRPYGTRDIVFLRRAAHQLVLAMISASAFARLEQLNEDLEQQIATRTVELNRSNEELNESLAKLKVAYAQLEQSHETLLRSDRLATLGRFTAGLAHEMNTPLSAVLNTLQIIGELAEEYLHSIDEAGVRPEDHREIATEILAASRSASEWTNKAAAYIRSVKAQGREVRAGTRERFSVRDVVGNARGLVAHRLRNTNCCIDFVEDSSDVGLIGDPGRLGQVLVNLITNAIDAYEDRGIADGRIEIRAALMRDSRIVTVAEDGPPQGRRSRGMKAIRLREFVSIQVRDWAGGIAPEALPHIFEELYTTKETGRGTGLGLWIARNLVEEEFGGRLDVATDTNGSCFTLELPRLSEGKPSETKPGEESGRRSSVAVPLPSRASEPAVPYEPQVA